MAKSAVSSEDAAADLLREFARRIDRLREDKAALAADMRAAFAKGGVFNTEVLHQVARHLRYDTAEIQEGSALLKVYLLALGEPV